MKTSSSLLVSKKQKPTRRKDGVKLATWNGFAMTFRDYKTLFKVFNYKEEALQGVAHLKACGIPMKIVPVLITEIRRGKK